MKKHTSFALFEQQLAKNILILDGAMGTMIQAYKFEEQDFRGDRFADWHSDVKGNNDLLVLTQPDIIKAIHLEYLEAGGPIYLKQTRSMLQRLLWLIMICKRIVLKSI